MQNSFSDLSLVRGKKTNIDETLPPVAQLIEGKSTKQWHFDLQGNEVPIDFVDRVHRDPWPIPMPVDREGYNSVEDSHYYWSSGLTDWLNVDSAISEFNIHSNERLKIIDVGCSTGRFLRHVLAFGEDRFDIWGADLGYQNIEWMKRHLPDGIKAFTNTIVPHLPFPDHFFDVLTGFSLMPHLEHLEDAWLLELKRITKPDGLLYLTFANESTWTDSINRPSTIKYVTRSNSIPGNEPLDQSSFEQPFPGERFVRRVSQEPVYNCYIWHKNDYVQQYWSRFLRIHRIVDFAHLRHQAVLLAQPE